MSKKIKLIGFLVLGVAANLSMGSGLWASSFYQYVTTLPPKADLPPAMPPHDAEQAKPAPMHRAEEGSPNSSEMNCSECEETYPVAYSPSSTGLCCDFGAHLEVNFLYWYARETNLSYALGLTEQPEIAGSDVLMFGAREVKHLDTSWDPGVRVGLGMQSCCGEFDFAFTWTWLKNSQSNTFSVPLFNSDIQNEVGSTFIIVPWMNQSFHRGGFALWDTVKAKWEFKINQFDIEVGRKYWTGCSFSLRPFAGVRAAFWDTDFRVTSSRQNPISLSTAVSKDEFDNDIWGVGPYLGIQPTWYLTNCFAIYGGADIAVLWGKQSSDKTERIINGIDSGEPANIDYRNRYSSDYYLMTPQLNAEIGIHLETMLCDCRFRTSLDIGFEHHILFDQNHRVQTLESLRDEVANITGFRTYAEATGNIGYGGLIIRGRFDF